MYSLQAGRSSPKTPIDSLIILTKALDLWLLAHFLLSLGDVFFCISRKGFQWCGSGCHLGFRVEDTDAFCIIEGRDTVLDFSQMQLQEIRDNVTSRRNKIFLLMEEVRMATCFCFFRTLPFHFLMTSRESSVTWLHLFVKILGGYEGIRLQFASIGYEWLRISSGITICKGWDGLQFRLDFDVEINFCIVDSCAP